MSANIASVDEEPLKSDLRELVRETVQETLNALLQVKHHFLLWKQVVTTRHLGQTGKARGHHGAIMPAVDALLELGAKSRAFRPWAYKRHVAIISEYGMRSPSAISAARGRMVIMLRDVARSCSAYPALTTM